MLRLDHADAARYTAPNLTKEECMKKIPIGPQTLIYPKPALLIGANVDGRPNFMTLAWGGIANGEPPMISVALRYRHHTLKGIRQNSSFSVNIPSHDMAKQTDYCGITTGAAVDKVKVCNFVVSYGVLNTAPLIEQCPVSLECQVVHIMDLGSHSLVVGRIVETYVSESCLTDGKPDVGKIRPLIYSGSPACEYLELGRVVAKAYSVGREMGQPE
jgi:flavin reductase (DIM6/NTAB) family NADH-FMN oxidoreductase RutF